jgi:hypothetical protein
MDDALLMVLLLLLLLLEQYPVYASDQQLDSDYNEQHRRIAVTDRVRCKQIQVDDSDVVHDDIDVDVEFCDDLWITIFDHAGVGNLAVVVKVSCL